MIRLMALSCLILLCFSPVFGQEKQKPQLNKEHPYLYIERSEVPDVLERAERYKWAGSVLENIRKTADELLEREIEYPTSTGRHSMVYVCPDCTESLKTLSPTEHQCPECEEVFSGLPYDAVLFKTHHRNLSVWARDLGLAWLFFDDERYARKALDILLGYAEAYQTYERINPRGQKQGPGAAKVYDQTLDESIWLIDIAWAYDLALGSGVASGEERRIIEEKLLRSSAELIRAEKRGISNWQSWHNAAMIAVGLTLKDEELIEEVIYGDNGYYFQMENSIMPDGLWYEGAWAYHVYSMAALLKTAEAAHRSGINLYTPELKRALEIHLQVLQPNGRAPALNNSGEAAPFRWHYELAAARYGDPIFQGWVAQGRRGGLETFLVAIDDPQEHAHALESIILEESGLGILRQGDQYLCLSFGPHGGWHGHYDKLSVVYYTANQVFAPDPGRGWPYNLPIQYEWYKQTLSHNTVLIDEQPQAEARGDLIFKDFSNDYHIVSAEVNEAYDGVKMKRTLAMSDAWLFDVFEVECEDIRTIDWVWHGRGDFETSLTNRPVEFKCSHVSYDYLSNVRRGSGWRDWSATWEMSGGKVHALFKGSPGRAAFLCNAPDNPRTNTLNSVLLRDRGRISKFVTLFSSEPMDWTDLPPELQAMVR